MGSYRRHHTSKRARKAHHKRLKTRLKGSGLFPFDDGRGRSKRQLSGGRKH